MGDVILSSESVASGNAFLDALGDSLNPTAEVYLYGCEVAATTTGKQFVSQLADVLKRPVFASVDVTGNSLQGGDWNLEYVAGHASASEHSSNTLHLSDSQFANLLEGEFHQCISPKAYIHQRDSKMCLIHQRVRIKVEGV